MPISGRNNSISCLESSVSYFEKQFELLSYYGEDVVKEFFWLVPGNGINNSTFCLDNSISCFENQIWTPQFKWETFYKRSFLSGGLEKGKILPIPVLKIILNLLDQMRNILLWGILIGGLKVGWISPFHVWRIPFPV